MLYRKKPTTVKAEQWFPNKSVEGVHRIPASKVDASLSRGIVFDRPERYICNTPEGQLEVSPGDWIVTGVRGEKYPVKPDAFAMSYEPVSCVPKAYSDAGRGHIVLGFGIIGWVVFVSLVIWMAVQ